MYADKCEVVELKRFLLTCVSQTDDQSSQLLYLSWSISGLRLFYLANLISISW